MPDLMQQLRLTLRTLLLCSVLIRNAWSLGIAFTSPNGGATLPAGPITITWADAGGNPSMAELLTYRLELVVGGNSQDDSDVLQKIGGADGVIADGSVQGEIAADTAQSIQNGFYLKMTSNTSAGNQVINYSNRFTLLNMNGTTDSVYLNGANFDAGNVNNVPSAQQNIISSPTSSTSIPTTGSSATNTAATSMSPPTARPSPPVKSHEPGPSGGVLAAIIAGSIFALIGVVSIIIWIMFFYRRMRRKRQEKRQHLDSEDGGDDEPVFLGNKTELAAYRSSRSITPAASPIELNSAYPKYELEGLEKPSEVPASPMVYELEGDMSCWEAGSGRRSQAWDPTR